MSTPPTSEEDFAQKRYVVPVGASQVFLIRHGASMPFVPGQLFELKDGHGDPALAPEGHVQATRLAERLLTLHAQRPFAALYVTTLQRTSQTIAPFAEQVGMSPVVIADLREVYLGEWEGGLTRQKMFEGGPIATKVLETGEWGHIPGAESWADLQARTVPALAALAKAHRDERIAVVVHGGVISALMSHACGGRARAFETAENTSLHELVITDEKWIVRLYNDTNHLD